MNSKPQEVLDRSLQVLVSSDALPENLPPIEVEPRASNQKLVARVEDRPGGMRIERPSLGPNFEDRFG